MALRHLYLELPAAALLCLVLSHCGGPSCTDDSCPTPLVCGWGGACEPLASPEMQFARSARFYAQNIGDARSVVSLEEDISLDFGELESVPQQAVLVVYGAPDAAVREIEIRIRSAIGSVSRRLYLRPARPVFIDVSEILDASGRLDVSSSDDDIEIAAPNIQDETLRPRLDVTFF